MNEIKKLLYTFLNTDSVKIIGMGKKIEDTYWLISNGYQKDFKTDNRGFKSMGEITSKGKAFFDEYERIFEQVYEKAKNNLTEENERRTHELIQKFVKNRPELDFLPNSSMYNGLTDDEKYAFLYFSQNPLDTGKR